MKGNGIMIIMALMILITLVSASATTINTEINAHSDEGDIGVSQTYMTNESVDADMDAVINGDFSLQTIFDNTENAYVNVGIDMNPVYDMRSYNEEGLTLKNLAYWTRETVQIINDGESMTGSTHPRRYMPTWLNSLAKIFATKREIQKIYDNQMEIHYRMVAIERTLEKLYSEEYCETKKEVMQDYHLPGTECGDWKYKMVDAHNGDEIIIGMKDNMDTKVSEETDQEESSENHSNTNENYDPLDEWDRMCDSGMQKWCDIAQKYRDLNNED